MDVFYSADVKSLFHNKFVVIIGDSIQRAIYKDLVLLLRGDRFLHEKELRNKGEFSFLDDELIEGGRKGEMTNGVMYTEVRQYVTDVFLIRFYFVTRCYNAYVESILSDLKEEPHPDIVIMNSCLWDITRYGKESIVDYKKNLVTLFDRFKEVLDEDCLVIWNTTLPISNQAKGGFLIPEIEFRTTTLRLDVLEANYYARSIIVERGFDVLDLHFYLRHHIDKRVRDGVHWDMMAHRYITNLLLSHICKASNAPTPDHKPAPFSSYPQQYDGKSLFMDFNNPGFSSSPIRQQAGPGQEKGSIFANMYRSWTNMMTSFNCCLPVFSGGQFEDNNDDHFRQGWHSSRDRRPAHVHNEQVNRHDPYRGHGSGPQGKGPYERQSRRNRGQRNEGNNYHVNAGQANFPTFNNPVFPTGQFRGPVNNNFPFSRSSFEPYQQNDYQGASHFRNRNRRKPYNRQY